ncbi:MAG: TraR/DksA C4-type zinc finger protein [Thermoguttaceae bacterium]
MDEERIPYFEAVCPECQWSELCGPEGMARRMVAVRRLKRTSDMSLEMLAELFQAAAGALDCPECGHVGLKLKPRSDLDENWPGGRACSGCGKTIPQERLEFYPDAGLCAACQGKADRGEHVGAQEYCPRCGTPMQLRTTRAGGITRYEMACTAVPPCRLRGR